MTYQGDQEYIKFYETVSSETKVWILWAAVINLLYVIFVWWLFCYMQWLEKFVEASTHEVGISQ
jgi:hypothetical protein